MSSQLQTNILNIQTKLNTVKTLINSIYTPPTPELPYTELEYISSTGTQYIDTGFTVTPETKVEITWSNVLSNGSIIVSGCNQWNYNTFCLCYQNVSGAQNHYRWMVGSSWQQTFFGTDADKTSKNTASLYKRQVVFNGTTIVDDTSISPYNNATTIRVLGEDRFTDQYLETNGYTLYSLKIYDNNVLVRDMIPVKRRSDNTICMYDKVNEQFYLNAGTGTFIAGPEV